MESVNRILEAQHGVLEGVPDQPYNKPDIQAQLEKDYPFSKYHDLSVKVTPGRQQYYAETYGKGEAGDPTAPRPSELPINSIGVEIYKPDKFSHHDLAGELLHVDPVANHTRYQMQSTFTPRQLAILKDQGDYIYPGAPSVDAANMTEQQRFNNATDALLRGYTVGQWPKSAIDDFKLSPKQKDLMENLSHYMKTGSIK